MHNLRAWTEWCDRAPEPSFSGHIEGEYVNGSGKIASERITLFHYADSRGSLWGYCSETYKTHGRQKTEHPKFYRWRFVGPLVPAPQMQGTAILVWRFHEAPGELQALSCHGGDEDWIAIVPKGAEPPAWAESGSAFGCCSVSEHEYEDGRTVFIGAHA